MPRSRHQFWHFCPMFRKFAGNKEPSREPWADTDGALAILVGRRMDNKMKGWPVDRTIRRWPRGFSVKVPIKTKLLDCVAAAANAEIVSTRFKEVCERVAPGQIQFLPITLTRYGRPIPGVEYWAAHMLLCIDCIDWKRVRWRSSPYDTEWRSPDSDLIIDAAKVPAGVHVFCPRHYWPPFIITRVLREALLDAKVTGLYTLPLKDTNNEKVRNEFGGTFRIRRQVPGARRHDKGL